MKNWHEERVLREETGVGRTMTKTHINKKHDDLFRKPPSDFPEVYEQSNVRDETFGRVFGRALEPKYVSEHRDKFAKRTLASEAVHGKKYELIEKQFIEAISQELQEADQNLEDMYNQRHMNTTYGNEFLSKTVGVNVVGRRVMKDQNGKSLPPNTRDQDLLVDHGFLQRSTLASEEQLQNAVKKEGYLTAQPYTFWSEKLNEGAYYNSQQTNDKAPFTKNNEFLKTFTQYTHIKK